METIVSLFLGPLAYWIVQEVKRRTGLQGIPALWLAFGVSVLLAVPAVLLAGGLTAGPLDDPVAFVQSLLAAAGAIFTTATLIYRHIRWWEERAVG
jgi:hypothetical protein